MILPGKRRAATVAISRFGEDCVILEPTDGTTNNYGKTDGENWSSVANESVVRTHGSRGNGRAQDRHTGGRLPADSPLFLLRYDTAAQEGFRVTYLGQTYELDAFTRYPSHIEASSTLVN